MITVLSIVTTVLSTSLLVVLGWRDPKRLRTLSKNGADTAQPFAASTRRLLTSAALAPGLVLAIAGAWQPFLIWLGATCTVAWLAVQVLSTATAISSDR